jgi:hypothetical protein
VTCSEIEVEVRSSLLRAALIACSAALLAPACGGGGDTPEAEKPQPLPQAASLIPVAPAPQPTATPTPLPEDEFLPPVGGVPGTPPGGSTNGTCDSPAPPPLAHFNVRVHGGNGDRTLLDSTPLVGPSAEYCRAIGFTDGRLFCPVRPEGSSERAACEAALVGNASDTGRSGPTWSVDGRPCDGAGDRASCVNHPSNQYLAYAWGTGTFQACAANGACGQIKLP